MDTGSKKDDIMHVYPTIDKIVERNNSKGKTIFHRISMQEAMRRIMAYNHILTPVQKHTA